MEVDPYHTGALLPPDGVVPNFVNAPSVHYVHVAVAIAAITTATLAIAARTYTRAKVMKRFGLDDCVLLLSLAMFAAYVTLTIRTGMYGQGEHQWNVTLARFSMLIKYVNYVEILYSPMMFAAKFVVLRQIESIFLQHKPRSISHRLVRSLMWANLLFYGSAMLSFILACIPREKIWNPTVSGRCIDQSAALIGSSAINILACIASVIRLLYTLRFSHGKDLTYEVEPFGYWSEIEYTTVVLVACFPVFPLLVRHIAQNTRTLLTSSRGGNKSQLRSGVDVYYAGSHPDHSSVRKLRAEDTVVEHRENNHISLETMRIERV
ncbi:hypothetical protein F5Y17DRAFT_472987 [Xylariaceae sp. FL0594]|nr:hypothetical protein F5Y17DRAFT_472987 [Xylariaceae sp. FL0594]